MTIFAWLMASAAPFLANALIGLGIGTVTYVGMGLLLDSLISKVSLSFQAVPVDLLVFLNMGGIIDAVSILLGAITSKLLLQSMTKFQLSNP